MWMESSVTALSLYLYHSTSTNSRCLELQVPLLDFFEDPPAQKPNWTVLWGKVGADWPSLPSPVGRHFFPDRRAGQRPEASGVEAGWSCQVQKVGVCAFSSYAFRDNVPAWLLLAVVASGLTPVDLLGSGTSLLTLPLPHIPFQTPLRATPLPSPLHTEPGGPNAAQKRHLLPRETALEACDPARALPSAKK